jgi:hypothetical protein
MWEILLQVSASWYCRKQLPSSAGDLELTSEAGIFQNPLGSQPYDRLPCFG